MCGRTIDRCLVAHRGSAEFNPAFRNRKWLPALNLGQSVYEENRLTIIVLTIADRRAAKAIADLARISMHIQILDMETVAAIDAHEKSKDLSRVSPAKLRPPSLRRESPTSRRWNWTRTSSCSKRTRNWPLLWTNGIDGIIGA